MTFDDFINGWLDDFGRDFEALWEARHDLAETWAGGNRPGDPALNPTAYQQAVDAIEAVVAAYRAQR